MPYRQTGARGAGEVTSDFPGSDGPLRRRRRRVHIDGNPATVFPQTRTHFDEPKNAPSRRRTDRGLGGAARQWDSWMRLG
jgi:hypothetical protein